MNGTALFVEKKCSSIHLYGHFELKSKIGAFDKKIDDTSLDDLEKNARISKLIIRRIIVNSYFILTKIGPFFLRSFDHL